MIWIYIVSWTLIFNGGQYGSLEGNFEKRFMNRNEATMFMEWPKATSKKVAFECKNFKLDSTKIDTSTVKKEPEQCDSIVFPRWNNPPSIQFYGGRSNLLEIPNGAQ